MRRGAVLLLMLFSIPLFGCTPHLRASWHLGEEGVRQPLVLPAEDEARPVPRPPIDGEAKRARIPPTVYLTLTNLEATALRVKDLTVNGSHLELHPSVFILSPGEIRVFDLGPFRCTLPLSIEFSDGGFWRHRVRGVPWLPSAPPENIEDWCR